MKNPLKYAEQSDILILECTSFIAQFSASKNHWLSFLKGEKDYISTFLEYNQPMNFQL